MEDLIVILVTLFSYLLSNILLGLIMYYFFEDSEVEDDSETQKVELGNGDECNDGGNNINK